MLGRAVKDHHPDLPGVKGTTLSQHYQAIAKPNPLKPTNPSVLNSSMPSWSQTRNPLKRTASQASENSQGQEKRKASIGTMNSMMGGGRVGKLHEAVEWDENDFDDDANIDLDENASVSTSLPPISRESSKTLVADSSPKSVTQLDLTGSTPLPWSSSPATHRSPLARANATTQPPAKVTKRRTLSWIDEAPQPDLESHARPRLNDVEREENRKAKTDKLCEDLGGYSTEFRDQWEKKRQDKKQQHETKNLNRQCEDLTGGGPSAIVRQRMRESRELGPVQDDLYDSEGLRTNIPEFVRDKIKRNQKKKFAGGDVDSDGIRSNVPDYVKDKITQARESKLAREAEQAYTPLPKDKGSSKYPWNTTASAVKEQQKQLRQGHRKLTKDHEGDEDSKKKSRKKQQSIVKVFLSDEQKSVLDLVSDKKKSVFFTGSAGTGKSVLLREIIRELRVRWKREPDRVAVTASTGLAACNIGGVTLHSFAGIGLGKEAVPELVKKIKRNQKAKTRWMRTKILIVDEISMVDGDLFDKLEGIARAIRNNGRPFGGIQLVITGDFFQLPPVPDYGRIAKFSFDAGTWNTSIEHTIGLTQIFRQKDPVFANMLNEMRLGKLTPESISSFRALNRPLSFTDDFEATELFPTRVEVDKANGNRMKNLSGREVEFRAEDGGSIVDVEQRNKLLGNCMATQSISLKKGAQVMLIKNIDDTLVNGSVGKVIAFMDEKTFDIYHEDEDEFQAVENMDLDDENMTKSRLKLKGLINKDLAGDTSQNWPLVRFAIADGTTRDLLCQRESWKVELPSGEIQASRSQIPLILAWALSIHKAQGQTLDRVKVDLGKIFEKGQAYVALSRATCQEGLQITRFDPKKVMAHERVRTFYDSLYSADKAMTSNFSTEVTVEKKGPKIPLAEDYENTFVDGGFGEEDEDAMAAMYGS